MNNDYLEKTGDYGMTAEDIKTLREELSALEKLQPTICVITKDLQIYPRFTQQVTWSHLLSKTRVNKEDR